ncbi:unnamed protein product, partial [Mesorhabditis belari]|uniref:C-type lectin domain-containing protein n=1 Tax=Mesorhabditis belari TaxID=2138241 RepID=A0AAF3FIU4_9BILA
MRTLYAVNFFLLFGFLKADVCPSYFTYQSDLDSCLLHLNTTESWPVAKTLCNQLGGELLSVHNAFQNSITANVQTNMTGSDKAWLGATRSSNGTWTWSDGTPFNYQRFSSPNDPGDCAYLDTNDVMWKITACSNQFQFLCASPSISTTPSSLTTTPSLQCLPPKQQPLYNCLQGWQYFNGSEYLVIFDKFFDDGEEYCVDQGGHLASIHHARENAFIQNLCCPSSCQTDHNKVWMAYYLLGGHWNDGKIVWSDGTPDDYRHEDCSDQQRQEGDNLLMFNWEQCSICATPGIWHYDNKDSEGATSPYLVRESVRIKSPGYMIHEAVQWSKVHRKWFFLPRRASGNEYVDYGKESMI